MPPRWRFTARPRKPTKGSGLMPAAQANFGAYLFFCYIFNSCLWLLNMREKPIWCMTFNFRQPSAPAPVFILFRRLDWHWTDPHKRLRTACCRLPNGFSMNYRRLAGRVHPQQSGVQAMKGIRRFCKRPTGQNEPVGGSAAANR